MGLGVELYGKAAEGGIVQPLAAQVVGVDKAQLRAPRHALAAHGVAVVLARDEAAAVRQAAYGLVCAPVAVFELDGLAPQGEGRELVPEADAEDRERPDELFELFDLENASSVSFFSPRSTS